MQNHSRKESQMVDEFEDRVWCEVQNWINEEFAAKEKKIRADLTLYFEWEKWRYIEEVEHRYSKQFEIERAELDIEWAKLGQTESQLRIKIDRLKAKIHNLKEEWKLLSLNAKSREHWISE